MERIITAKHIVYVIGLAILQFGFMYLVMDYPLQNATIGVLHTVIGAVLMYLFGKEKDGE